MKFTQEDKKEIEQAVLKAEKKTNGEIVPVIVKSSDTYPSAHFRWALLMSFLSLVCVYWMGWEEIYFIYAFIVGSFLGFFLAYLPFYKKLVLTKDQLEEEFRQRALESFLMNGVSETKNRNGVQLFISAFEHKAMIISDIGIQEKLNNKLWEDIIKEMVPKLKKREYKSAIIDAIESIGLILAEHFPEDHHDEDELSNKLVIEV